MATQLHFRQPQFLSAFHDILIGRQRAGVNRTASVAALLAAVEKNGDAALLEQGTRFDHLPTNLSSVQNLIITPTADDLKALSADDRAALEKAAERIEYFHRRLYQHYQLDKDFALVDDLGVGLGLRWSAIERIGIYVPGGLAAYPSSVLMNALPARVAGVRHITMASPLGFQKPWDNTKTFNARQQANPHVLAAAYLAGISSILCLGGAGAIGAMAYGTASVAAVDKIVGPGNDFVAEAKRQVFGRVGIDVIAGPSEILILADDSATKGDLPHALALDLLSQAEHDPAAMAMLITDSEETARTITTAVDALLATAVNDPTHRQKQSIAATSWRNHGAVIVVADIMKDGAALANLAAAEHVEVIARDRDRQQQLAKLVNNAGAIFLGPHSPEAFGDYLAGPSHVLPTSGTARFSSGLSIFDFLKRSSMIEGNQQALNQLGPAIINMATAEQLPHHARSISSRMKDKK